MATRSSSSEGAIGHIEASLEEACACLGEGDVAPTDEARRALAAHIQSVPRAWPLAEALPLPDVTTVGDGEVSCEWEQGDWCFLLVVYPDGSIFPLRGRMVDGAMVDRQPPSAPEPAHTIAALRWLVLRAE